MQMQIPIGNMPVHLVLLSNGTVVFVKVAPVGVVYDTPEIGIHAMFTDDEFRIGGEDYQYCQMYEYKNIPEMLQWLIQQRLEWPQERVVFM
jgi:hypothetical protein